MKKPMKAVAYVLVTVALLTPLFKAPAALAESELFGEEMRKKVAIYQRDMARIENKLNEITTMVSTFTQIAPNGERSTGVFYLSRPGRLRWEYKEPTPLQIIAKGSVLVYFDVELDQVSHVSLDDTLANFLTREKIRFDDEDIAIQGFTRDNSEVAVTVAKKQVPEEGQLTLVFGSTSLEMQRMEVVDSTGNRTQIFFESSVYGVPVDEKLFVLPKFRGAN